jgi:four helix bundle protein
MDDTAMDNELAAWDDRQPKWDKTDPLWTLLAYRLARWTLDLALQDLKHLRGVSIETRDQLHRAITSISTNVAEGHARNTARDRARFYNYALGSAREAGIWYASIGSELPDGVADARLAILSRIRKLLYGLARKGDAPRWLGPRRKPGDGAGPAV